MDVASRLDVNDVESMHTIANELLFMQSDFSEQVFIDVSKKTTDELKRLTENEYTEPKAICLLEILRSLITAFTRSSSYSTTSSLFNEIINSGWHAVYVKFISYYLKLNDAHYDKFLICVEKIYCSLKPLYDVESIAVENVNSGLIKLSLDLIKTKEFFTDELLQNGSAMSAYHNLIGFFIANAYCSVIKQDLIELNTVQILLDHKTNKLDEALKKGSRKNELELIKADFVTVLSRIMTDDELNSSSITEEIVVTIIDMLQKALDASTYNTTLFNTTYYFTYNIAGSSSFILATRIMLRLIRISVNDSVKQRILDNGAMPIVVRLLETGNEEEQEKSCELICSLCFNENVQNYIRNNEHLFKLIQEKRDKTSNSTTKTYCVQILELINQKLQGRIRSARSSKTLESTKGHVMISYNHHSKSECLKLNKKLKEQGYKTWIDADYTIVDLHDTMAKAVENAFVILICYSDAYKNSSNCRIEAQYAIDCHKPIIAIRMERKFRPDGWLGIILSGKFYLDFTTSDDNTVLYENLFRQIELTKNGGSNNNNTQEESYEKKVEYPLQTPRPLSKSQQSQKERIRKWTIEQTQHWFTTQEQIEIFSALGNINGMVLTSLWELKRHDIGTLCNQIDKQVEKSKVDVPFAKKMMFFQQLDDLFQK